MEELEKKVKTLILLGKVIEKKISLKNSPLKEGEKLSKIKGTSKLIELANFLISTAKEKSIEEVAEFCEKWKLEENLKFSFLDFYLRELTLNSKERMEEEEEKMESLGLLEYCLDVKEFQLETQDAQDDSSLNFLKVILEFVIITETVEYYLEYPEYSLRKRKLSKRTLKEIRDNTLNFIEEVKRS